MSSTDAALTWRNAARDPAVWILALLVAVWVATFVRLPLLRHDRFGTFGFDLGIYDQGTWLLAHGRDPFVTIRGLDLFGHHVNVILLALAPFYRLGAGPEFLLWVQVLAQASGAFAMFLLARDRIGNRWAGVAMAVVLLANPTYQYLTWEFFHPDAIAIGPLLFAYWAAREHRWHIFWVAAAIALACKEDVALSIAVIGLLVLFGGERRLGAAIVAIAGGWFLVATRVVIPFFNGIGPFYDDFFGDELGHSPARVVYNSLRHPTQPWRRATDGERLTWYWRMWAPVGFVSFLNLRALSIAFPMIAINVLAAFPYTRDYRFHYSSLVLAGTMAATVEAIAWSTRTARARLGHRSAIVTRNGLLAAVLATALVTTYYWGASPLGRDYESGIWPLQSSERNAIKAEAIGFVPDNASTSAIYNLVPHLAHREQIYEFPVPWCNINWGVRAENLHDPAGVDWVVVDRQLLGEADLALLDDLLSHEFAVRFDSDGIVAAERVAPPDVPRVTQPSNGACDVRQPRG